MKLVTDFHIHSRFSRATSNDITLDNLEKWARIKGVDLLGTGDFQNPKWFKEINEKLKEDENGVLWTKNKFPFIWQTEISLMYTQDGRGRRIHHLILSPNKDISEQIISALGKKGRLDYDGRPIFGFTSIELVDMMMSISKDIEIIPAHIWTPYFAIFGSMSGFDSVQECFKEKSKYIHALETGISSDPAMNWMISGLDKYTLISNSDAHSYWPWRLGREANVLDINLSYKEIIKAIRTKKGFVETIEADPNYGKYHFDGHRDCNFSCSPEESKKLNNICPVCKKKLTIGVLNRVQQLADRDFGYLPDEAIPFKKLIPLSELISATYNINQLYSKKIWEIYNKLIEKFKNEFNVLLYIEYDELIKIVDKKLADNILLNRESKINIKPGYDGNYGELIFSETNIPIKNKSKKQKTLTDF
jgi:uncharacterized protein (TIGR00375 family)